MIIYPGAYGTVQPYSNGYPPSHGGRHGRQQQQGQYHAPGYPAYGGGYAPVYPEYVRWRRRIDATGRPLYMLFEGTPQTQTSGPTMEYPASTPDLSGSPYVVIDGGTMIADFGNGDRRAVPACAVVTSASTPDGQPRTLFYRPRYQLILRTGQRGQVLGRPSAGARVCYRSDATAAWCSTTDAGRRDQPARLTGAASRSSSAWVRRARLTARRSSFTGTTAST